MPAFDRQNRPRVLIVEDDPSTYGAMRKLLEHHEFEVELACTVQEARGKLQTDPQFVLLDLMLPDGGGEEILDLVNRRRLSAKVAVITGMEDPHRLRYIEQMNPFAILRKPLNFSELLYRMQKVT